MYCPPMPCYYRASLPEYRIAGANRGKANLLRTILMNRISRSSQWLSIGAVLAFAATAFAQSKYPLVQISKDMFHNSDSQHKSEVEPDTYSWGSTMVTAFQVARIYGGGG